MLTVHDPMTRQKNGHRNTRYGKKETHRCSKKIFGHSKSHQINENDRAPKTRDSSHGSTQKAKKWPKPALCLWLNTTIDTKQPR